MTAKRAANVEMLACIHVLKQDFCLLSNFPLYIGTVWVVQTSDKAVCHGTAGDKAGDEVGWGFKVKSHLGFTNSLNV